jgi:Dolichyl-phosphate-mannose-protein mannosyltransferase
MDRAQLAPELSESSTAAARRFVLAQLVAFAVALWMTIPAEVVKFRAASATKIGFWAWFYLTDIDTTFPFVLLAVVPFVWFVRRRAANPPREGVLRKSAPNRGVNRKSRRNGDPPSDLAQPFDKRAWTMAVACFLTSIAASAWVASTDVAVDAGLPPVRFGNLPPAIHDEFSYLFQAKTFLAGRLSFPSATAMPELFNQMHVLNEGRFASRYFPGAGLWIAPFLAAGHPYWGQWLAGALTAFFVYWAGRELAGNWVAFAAGLLTAVSPGMAIFCNLLLSHGPTMAALAVFLFCFLRFMRTGRAGDAFWAGCGLSCAMLCRPMTAAGFGLPFGAWLAWRLVGGRAASLPIPSVPNAGSVPAGRPIEASRMSYSIAALAAPLLVGLVTLFLDNRAVTGNGLVSPYQLYTDIYTPRHVYGFNNVTRGEQHLGPKVLENYDRWATNLTPRVAVQNVRKRAEASAEWTLGPVPIAMAALIFVIAVVWQVEWRWRLIAASIVSLHAVHVSFWPAGIMNWSYVFETTPLLLLLFAITSHELVQWWRSRGQILMAPWWAALVASAVVINWLPCDPFWSTRIDAGVAELALARVKYEKVDRLFEHSVTHLPALVLIDGDPEDIHVDFVVNDPALSAPLLRGRYQPGKTDLKKIRAAFPDRALSLYRVSSQQLMEIDP